MLPRDTQSDLLETENKACYSVSSHNRKQKQKHNNKQINKHNKNHLKQTEEERRGVMASSLGEFTSGTSGCNAWRAIGRKAAHLWPLGNIETKGTQNAHRGLVSRDRLSLNRSCFFPVHVNQSGDEVTAFMSQWLLQAEHCCIEKHVSNLWVFGESFIIQTIAHIYSLVLGPETLKDPVISTKACPTRLLGNCPAFPPSPLCSHSLHYVTPWLAWNLLCTPGWPRTHWLYCIV